MISWSTWETSRAGTDLTQKTEVDLLEQGLCRTVLCAFVVPTTNIPVNRLDVVIRERMKFWGCDFQENDTTGAPKNSDNGQF